MENLITIIAGCKANNDKQQKALYQNYHAFALKIVFRYIYNYEEALEVTNDGFVKIFLKIEKFKMEDTSDVQKIFAGWLKRIMINTSIDLLRKKMLLPEIGEITDHMLGVKDSVASAEQLAIYKDLITMVKKLPPAYRIVFNMNVIDGYTHTEIAETLKIPVGTSKSNLMRARNLLQKYLQQNESTAACSI